MTEQEKAMYEAIGLHSTNESVSDYEVPKLAVFGELIWKAALEWTRTQQEPVLYGGGCQFTSDLEIAKQWEKDGFELEKYYTNPAHAPLVRLSDDEALDLFDTAPTSDDPQRNILHFTDAIQDAMIAKCAAQQDVSELVEALREAAEAIELFCEYGTIDQPTERKYKARKALTKWEGKQ